MRKILFLSLVVLLAACAHVKDEWVELEDFSSLDPAKSFIPFSGAEIRQMTQEEFDQCLLPGGVSSSQAEAGSTDGLMRTTSFNGTALAKELFSFWHSDWSRSYTGSYMSVDENGHPIRLSGRIILPYKGEVSRIMVADHFTIGNNLEAPSKSFPLEGIFAARGLAVIMPDYIGYGLTADRVHPYLCSDLTARNVIDMYFAALPFLKHIGRLPKNDDIFLFGYSQGGATTIAVQRMLERDHPEVKIHLNLAGGGPYDICVTYDKMIENDYTSYPCAIPMIIQGLNVGDHLDLDYAEYFQPHMLANMDDWLNSKRYYMGEITELMGSKQLSHVMTKNACNKVTDSMTKLYLSMLTNSVTHDFYPQAPIYMFHSIDDKVVPFENATAMKFYLDNMEANVTYNFGVYGDHPMAFIRFLYTSLNLLHEKGDIPALFWK